MTVPIPKVAAPHPRTTHGTVPGVSSMTVPNPILKATPTAIPSPRTTHGTVPRVPYVTVPNPEVPCMTVPILKVTPITIPSPGTS